MRAVPRGSVELVCVSLHYFELDYGDYPRNKRIGDHSIGSDASTRAGGQVFPRSNASLLFLAPLVARGANASMGVAVGARLQGGIGHGLAAGQRIQRQ